MGKDWGRDWVISPGETLLDWMEENGLVRDGRPLTKVVATCCRGLEEKDVQGVLDGKRRIGNVLACKLQVATGISAQIWLNLERAFRQGLAEGKTWSGGKSVASTPIAHDSNAALREGDVVLMRNRTYTVVGWTSRGKIRLQAPGLATETTGWWRYAADLPGHLCEVWRGEERIR